jgi:hypothetical protein
MYFFVFLRLQLDLPVGSDNQSVVYFRVTSGWPKLRKNFSLASHLLPKNCAKTSHLLLTCFPKTAQKLPICFSKIAQKLLNCFSPA